MQHQQDKIKYQELRLISGTGPRFRLVENNSLSLFLCPLLMYEHEREFEAANQTIETQVFKGDLYAVLVYKISDELLFRHVTYYQPAIIDFNGSDNFEPIKDFRVASETGITFKFFNKKLEFSTIFKLSHDSRPPGLYIIETGKTKLTFMDIKNEIRLNF